VFPRENPLNEKVNTKMRITLLIVVSVTAFGGGCAAVQSKPPLVDEQHAVYEPELIGKWVSYQNVTRVLDVEAAESRQRPGIRR